VFLRTDYELADRLAVYLTRISEQFMDMLAYAKIGAIHTLVYSAFSAGYPIVSKNTCTVRPMRSRLSGLTLSAVSETVCQ